MARVVPPLRYIPDHRIGNTWLTLHLASREHPAEEVYVTGTFDDWTKSVKLEKEDGVFQKTVDLKPSEKIYYKVGSQLPVPLLFPPRLPTAWRTFMRGMRRFVISGHDLKANSRLEAGLVTLQSILWVRLTLPQTIGKLKR